ncbi:hypothetical protein L2E82_28425 [Cichorium intybus]|uniref:Uncharacterized protein n=1 Tax=Cichorium intybus TaxID=13427 RepID=A0ACB9CVZ9_CICIN|nr:hypothetical protein L2E82_28425 [Cichorium intybus]
MERVKRRRLKFPCLFGGNDENPKHRTIQTWCPGNATTEQSLFKFEVGKSTSNQNKKRSSSILAKLMVKDVISSINKKQRIKLKRKEVSKSDINESEVITVLPSRITFGSNDRLTHSLSNISEPSLIREAKNKISEKWKLSHIHEDVGISVAKSCTLREILSFSEKETKPMELDTTTSCSTSINLQYFQDSNHGTDDVAGHKIEMSSETSNKLKPKQLSRRESEYSESLKEVDNGNQVSVLEVPPTQNVSCLFNDFERLNNQLRDLKKQLHLLKIESIYSSNRPTPTQKRIQHVQQSSVASTSTCESSLSSHILQVLDIYKTDPDTVHHPRDPSLFNRIEKYYFEGAILSKSEKHLLYDYTEQTFIKISKSMAAGPDNEPILSNLSIEDQVVKVIEEIKKEDAEIFVLNNYDKDPEWLQHNQINNLVKLLSELVLTDLVLEVISS